MQKLLATRDEVKAVESVIAANYIKLIDLELIKDEINTKIIN